MNPVSPMIKIGLLHVQNVHGVQDRQLPCMRRSSEAAPPIYRPRQIPRPLTLMEKLRIARAKVHAEQAKKINNLFIKLLLLLLYYYKLKRYY